MEEFLGRVNSVLLWSLSLYLKVYRVLAFQVYACPTREVTVWADVTYDVGERRLLLTRAGFEILGA